MGDPALSTQSNQPDGTPKNALRRTAPPLPPRPPHANLPVMLKVPQAQSNNSLATPLRYVDSPETKTDSARAARKQTAVLRGIKDLQQLQKQTIAVLEAVKANLEDIQQVLRSPEATRGMEKQKNAATLLAKGFPAEAIEQALGAVELLPANPEAHLLLSLSLAADQQFDNALAAARKGLALFDRRTHPLAIEAALLHALAALGCGPEAVERWFAILDALPIPVLLENLPRITACFPSDAPEGQLDQLVTRRLARDPGDHEEREASRTRSRTRRVETKPDEIPANALFAGLEAAYDARLTTSHRAILGLIAQRLHATTDPTDLVRFLHDCVIPLGNRGLDRSANALGRSAVKRLLRLHADAPTLHRAMTKLEMAGALNPAKEIATLLDHWRRAGSRLARAKQHLLAGTLLAVAGTALLGYSLLQMKPNAPLTLFGINPVYPALASLGIGFLLATLGLLNRTWSLDLPHDRPPLAAEELRYLRSAAVRRSLRGLLTPR